MLLREKAFKEETNIDLKDLTCLSVLAEKASTRAAVPKLQHISWTL